MNSMTDILLAESIEREERKRTDRLFEDLKNLDFTQRNVVLCSLFGALKGNKDFNDSVQFWIETFNK